MTLSLQLNALQLPAPSGGGGGGGRPPGLSKKARHTAIIAEKLYQEGELTVREICEQLSISKGTLYNYLRHRGVAVGTARGQPPRQAR